MILQALNRYYQILLDDPNTDISSLGFSKSSAHMAVILSESGQLLGLTSLMTEELRGKKTIEVPLLLRVPEYIQPTSNIKPNFLFGKTDYVLGISKEGEADDNSIRKFLAFKDYNIALLEQCDSKASKVMSKFLREYDPKCFVESEIFQQNKVHLKNAYLVFKLLGSKDFIHNDPEIEFFWISYKNKQSDAPIGQCLITGEKTEIALTHSKIKNIKGGHKAGMVLVGFQKKTSYESFNKTGQQGMNAPVGREAMFAYTTTLNYLSRNYNQKIEVGNDTIFFWAESSDPIYINIYKSIFNATDEAKIKSSKTRDEKAEVRLHSILRNMQLGKPIDINEAFQDIDKNTRFFVMGVSPNKSRLSIRFFFTDPFNLAISNLMLHHKDMTIFNEYGKEDIHYSIPRIVWETVSPKAKKADPDPLLTGAVFRSILMNLPYPAALYNAILIRIRADQDDKEARIRKINHLRAAIIKAYLIRKYRNQNKYQEELQMSLNKVSTNQAYLLGRLFAVLEKAQLDAAGKDLNATIKDRYFTSACATPATTFPVLLRLSQHHITKSDYGKLTDRRIQEIMGKLEVEETPFPKHLNLDEQGIFVLGYYHQKADFYLPKTDVEKLENQED